MNINKIRHIFPGVASLLVGAISWNTNAALAADAYIPFTGEKTSWHNGFDRYDFMIDEETLAIKQAKAPENEGFGAGAPMKDQRRCIVIVPGKVASGSPWAWRGCYWGHEPQTEIELLKRGFHIAYITANASLKPNKTWDAWYAFLTEEHGLSTRPAFIGMSRGGTYSYTWATKHSDKVSCIYGDNPGISGEALMKLVDLAHSDVPILHICGSIDPILGKYSSRIESIYQQLGGRISVMIKEGSGHHPHSLRDPKPIADFIVQSVQSVDEAIPSFVDEKAAKSSYYSNETFYRNFPSEGLYIACRGPLFTPCYNRYSFELAGIEGPITVIEPESAAPGKPWVFRADLVDRNAAVDLALLARGFHIITGPVPFNFNGPLRSHWDAVYKHLTEHGFSKKPVMGGAGAAAGEAYAWAMENPDKVSSIYGENPVLRSNMAKTQPIDNLAPLAKAGIPLFHVCGGLDPHLNDNTQLAEKRYKELGGRITVLVLEGEGRFLSATRDPKPAVNFITENAH